MYITIQIDATAILAINDLNDLLNQGDSSKPHEGLNNIIDFINAIQLGFQPATITAVTSTNAGTVSGQTGGVSVSYNLT